LRKYSPPPSEDIELPGFFERDVILLAVNICRMKSLLGYKIIRIPMDLTGYCWTPVEFNNNKNNSL
jgi:hypothetical protein